MENIIHTWLYSLIAGGCICSLILFISTDSKLKSLLETGCACLMILIFLTPFKEVKSFDISDQAFKNWTTIESDILLNQNYENIKQTFMESEYKTYIFQEANAYGIDLTDVIVYSEQDQNGYWIPVSVELFSILPISDQFKEHITNTLGVVTEENP